MEQSKKLIGNVVATEAAVDPGSSLELEWPSQSSTARHRAQAFVSSHQPVTGPRRGASMGKEVPHGRW